MPRLQQPVRIEGEFYNVGEEYTMYDTVAIVQNLEDLTIQPPGWYPTFALAANAQHWFFNVRTTGNCEDAYCNLDARDTTSYAFQADSISCAFWGSGYNSQRYEEDALIYERLYLPNAIWQGYLPFEASLTFRVQQDDKVKVNAMMASPGYGPVGGGFGNLAASGQVPLTEVPNLTCQTQGMAQPNARIKFPNVINMPRRASISAEVNFTAWGRNLLTNMPGPGSANYWNVDFDAFEQAHIMYGITVGIHGRRLVQQRGELHA